MLQRLRNRQKGFTLIELLIVVAIIGIIAALLIPNFLDAIQKGKQKRTQGDMRSTGTAMMAWLTDQISAGAAGEDADGDTWAKADYVEGVEESGELDELKQLLETRYIQRVPEKDGWKGDFSYFLKTAPFHTDRYMYIHSGGRDGADMEDTYQTGPFEPTDYIQDIVWADGFFIRWPEKVDDGGDGG